MKVRVSSRGIEGLGGRLGARVLTSAAEKAAARAAADLARRIATATGAAPAIAGTPARPLVRVGDAAVLDRVRGDAGREGDPVLDRVRLDFNRRRRAARTAGEGTP
ncbi:hypothetical protein [Xanthobacter agilis]|uniref:hypothetical protein n=1 Tax=Xanthobacter agilis TaxID=47492 RepID=UPI0037287637